MPLSSSAPGDFLGPDLAASPDAYAHYLTDDVRAELSRLLAAIARGEDVETHVRAVVSDSISRTAAALATGPGLILLRGVPVEGHDRATLATLFTIMGRALGRPMPQNLDGEIVSAGTGQCRAQSRYVREMATRTKVTHEAATERPSFSEVQRELTNALGTPKKSRGILKYKAPESAKQASALVNRVHEAGGAASLAEAHPARQLCAVAGLPSMLMDLVTWVKWKSKSARKALDMLHADAGVRIANINYANFVIELERAPKDSAAHAKRLAKIVMQGDAKKIEAALKSRRWQT